MFMDFSMSAEWTFHRVNGFIAIVLNILPHTLFSHNLRDTARVLKINPTTVIEELKKSYGI
jgi:hypothetical protein